MEENQNKTDKVLFDLKEPSDSQFSDIDKESAEVSGKFEIMEQDVADNQEESLVDSETNRPHTAVGRFISFFDTKEHKQILLITFLVLLCINLLLQLYIVVHHRNNESGTSKTDVYTVSEQADEKDEEDENTTATQNTDTETASSYDDDSERYYEENPDAYYDEYTDEYYASYEDYLDQEVYNGEIIFEATVDCETYLNVREEPYVDYSEVLCHLYPGTIVYISGYSENGWVYVWDIDKDDPNFEPGWVDPNYLSE